MSLKLVTQGKMEQHAFFFYLNDTAVVHYSITSFDLALFSFSLSPNHSLYLTCPCFSCFPLLLVFIDFPQTTRRIGSNLSYEQAHPVTQPGSACALSFIYESHYQCSAEQNNSDVIAFISFSVLTEWNNLLWPPATVPWRAETKMIIKTFKSFKNLCEECNNNKI